MATWQEECRAQGGQVTVMPTPGSYVPACRLPNGDGTSKYLDMRSWDETLADNEMLLGEQWDIALGNAVTVRDQIVDAAKSALSMTAVLAVCGVGILLLLRERK
jgi:putative hemolysin